MPGKFYLNFMPKIKRNPNRAKSSFTDRVRAVVRQIQKGETLSYVEVARRAGNPRASRAVGNILSKNYDPKIPCHRVIRSDLDTGGYNRGSLKKVSLLRAEGVRVYPVRDSEHSNGVKFFMQKRV